MAVSRTPIASERLIPMAAQPVKTLPEGDEWLYELKLDGSPYTGTVTSIGGARGLRRNGAMSADGGTVAAGGR